MMASKSTLYLPKPLIGLPVHGVLPFPPKGTYNAHTEAGPKPTVLRPRMATLSGVRIRTIDELIAEFGG